MTGFNLPPGVTTRMIDEAAGVHDVCECCGHLAEDCICPECPACGEAGNRSCYKHGHLQYTKAQRLGQARAKIAQMQDAIADQGLYIAWLEDKPDDWKDSVGVIND